MNHLRIHSCIENMLLYRAGRSARRHLANGCPPGIDSRALELRMVCINTIVLLKLHAWSIDCFAKQVHERWAALYSSCCQESSMARQLPQLPGLIPHTTAIELPQSLSRLQRHSLDQVSRELRASAGQIDDHAQLTGTALAESAVPIILNCISVWTPPVVISAMHPAQFTCRSIVPLFAWPKYVFHLERSSTPEGLMCGQ